MLKSVKQNHSSINCRKLFFGATSPKWSPLVPSSFAGRSSVVINAGQSRIFWNFGMNISQNLPQFCTQTASMLCRCNLDELCLVILIISLSQIPSDLFCYMAQNLACKCELAPRQILWVFTEEQNSHEPVITLKMTKTIRKANRAS